MINHLAETVTALASTMKECCPSPRDAPYHMHGWHESSEGLVLMKLADVSADDYKPTGDGA